MNAFEPMIAGLRIFFYLYFGRHFVRLDQYFTKNPLRRSKDGKQTKVIFAVSRECEKKSIWGKTLSELFPLPREQ
jgi:hypothetical protein